ncbi:Uncharacterized protein FWK35_00028924 [Aphis craccivora]|uniref:Uncharacterized protein n=1 Tax=Aphis craccivora TaxID=307492 RepID=A0A6G0VY62_APHCR|nr:Uncharacterized protein FWK35_00028924 [Aphis craccivora]
MDKESHVTYIHNEIKTTILEKYIGDSNRICSVAKYIYLYKLICKENLPHIDFWHEAIKVKKLNSLYAIKNWVITFKSFEYLWLKLKADNFKNINQDSLECLFSSISHSVRYNMPNAMHFWTSFKTLSFYFSSFETTSIGEMTIGYVSGYIIRTILKSVRYCVVCKNDWVDNTNDNKLINARCYSNNNLFRPSTSFNEIDSNIGKELFLFEIS